MGYTNAGKSTLLNYLTGAGVLSEDKLFATLDPTTRSLTLPNGEKVLLTDTVGFIRKLPHNLIDAFKSTLEEAKYADVLIHVADGPKRDSLVQGCIGIGNLSAEEYLINGKKVFIELYNKLKGNNIELEII